MELDVHEVAERAGLAPDVVRKMEIARMGLRGQASRLQRSADGWSLSWTWSGEAVTLTLDGGRKGVAHSSWWLSLDELIGANFAIVEAAVRTMEAQLRHGIPDSERPKGRPPAGVSS